MNSPPACADHAAHRAVRATIGGGLGVRARIHIGGSLGTSGVGVGQGVAAAERATREGRARTEREEREKLAASRQAQA